MSQFILAFIISAVCGLLFGLGAYLTALRVGSPLSTPEAATGAAFRIGYKEYSLSTGNALVALVALSLLCIVVVPLVVFWADKSLKARDAPIYLTARFEPSIVPMTVQDPDESSVTSLNLMFCKTGIASHFTVSADESHNPVVIAARYDVGNDEVIGTANGMPFKVFLNGGEQAEIPGVVAWPTSAPGNPPKTLTRKPFVPPAQRLTRDPKEITNAIAGGQSQ